MRHVLIEWAILTAAVWLTAMILPGVKVRSLGAAIFVAALFGVLDFFVGHFLFAAIVVMTLGVGYFLKFLTWWLINTLLLKLTDALTTKLTIRTWGTAFVAALVMSGLATLGQWLLHARHFV